MTSENQFNQAVERWIEHCNQPSVRVSSNGYEVVDCGPFREITSIGVDALPLIRALYDSRNVFHGKNDGDVIAFPIKKVVPKHDFYFDTLAKLQYSEKEKFDKAFGQTEDREVSLSVIKHHGLHVLVREIVGSDFEIPEEIRGRMSEIPDYTKAWIDKNIDRYVTA